MPFAWLLDRGPGTLWLTLTVVSLAGAGLSALLGTVMPEASRRVTNRAEPAVDAALEG